MSRTVLSQEWGIALEKLRFAFQPIVRTSDGRAFGYEAPLRGWKEAGFPSIESVFDAAFIDAALSSLDMRPRAKSLADFAA